MPQPIAILYFSQALQADPNLTDDMFVLEAPSFIVPYVYEKPPKETFKDFKISVKKLAAKEIKKKEEGTDKEENDKEKKEKEDTEEEKDKDEEGTEEDDDDDETKKEKQVKAGNVSDDDDVVEEVKDDTKKASGNYFETTLGKFLIDLGMNMVQEFVQEDLLKELTKKSHRDKSASMMHSIASLKNNLVIFYCFSREIFCNNRYQSNSSFDTFTKYISLCFI